MTEYWKSNPMHWCDICKCWMQDTDRAKLNHERGATHQDLLEKKLRSMEKDAAFQKTREERTQASLKAIENAAQRQFAKDQAAARAAVGTWVWDTSAGLFYHETYRWYFDPKTKWYYGGEPADWTEEPSTSSLPPEARYEHATSFKGSAPTATTTTAATVAAGKVPSSSTSTTPAPAAAKPAARVLVVPKHPMASIGGYQAPLEGKIGGLKGAGLIQSESTTVSGGKHKRSDAEGGSGKAGAGGKPMDKAEQEALVRREAARKRVEQRTKSVFGYT